MGTKPRADAAPTLYRCSFCFKTQDRVAKLISGPGVMICNECVDLCVPIMAAAPTPEPEQMMTPAKAPTDQLLGMLKGYDTASESVDEMMRGIIDVLRDREVSWAAIGQTLGVSRQAAWKRFC